MSEHSFAIRDHEARIGGRSGRSFNRNRDAKYKFLADSNGAPFQRGSTARRSLPGKSRIDQEAADEEEFKNVDLSVPGTPVSSRHVMALKYRNKLAEQDKQERERKFEEQLSEEDPLKRFLLSMKALNAMKSAESSIVVEVPALKPVLQRRNSYGYNNIGTWNSPSNLQGYTVLFQRSMSAKVDYDQKSSATSNLESDTTNGNLMDEPDDKIDLVDVGEDNGSSTKEIISPNEKPAAEAAAEPEAEPGAEPARENRKPDKEIEKVEAKSVVKEPVKYVEKIEKVEKCDQKVTEKPKSKDKSKNRYLNFWRKLTGGKDQEKKVDTSTRN